MTGPDGLEPGECSFDDWDWTDEFDSEAYDMDQDLAPVAPLRVSFIEGVKIK